MYQQREKFCSLNLLMTSSAKRHWQSKIIIAECENFSENRASQYIYANRLSLQVLTKPLIKMLLKKKRGYIK
jgi:hypothetical protein